MRGKRVSTGEEVIPEFFSWFKVHKSPVVRSSMIQSVRKAAKLGDPPEKFYTNASESTNNVLKLKVDRKQQSLPDFVNHAKELVSTYEKNIERAFYQRGDWRLADTLSSLLPQKSCLTQILTASIPLSDLISAASLTPSTSTAAQSNAASLVNPVDVVPGQSTTGRLSIAPHVLLEASSINIHEDTLRNIWSKAELLVKGASLVVPVPGSKSRYDRMVASNASECPHHITTPVKFTGQFRCDSKCPMYGTYKICSHTVAAAEHCGQLKLFLDWLIKQNVTPNLSHMALSGIPKGAGKKGGKPSTSKRKRQTLSQPCSSKQVVDRVEAGTSICASSINNRQMPYQPQYQPQYQPLYQPLYQHSFFPSTHSQVVSPFPFSLKLLTLRIQLCQSCRIHFHPENDQPPYNLVICRKECRPYRGKDGQMRTPSSPSNSHYHVNLSCIYAADSTFSPDRLLVPDDVHELLLPEHKQFVFAMLGLQIS